MRRQNTPYGTTLNVVNLLVEKHNVSIIKSARDLRVEPEILKDLLDGHILDPALLESFFSLLVPSEGYREFLYLEECIRKEPLEEVKQYCDGIDQIKEKSSNLTEEQLNTFKKDLLRRKTVLESRNILNKKRERGF